MGVWGTSWPSICPLLSPFLESSLAPVSTCLHRENKGNCSGTSGCPLSPGSLPLSVERGDRPLWHCPLAPPTYSPELAPAAPPSALFWRASNTASPQPRPASGRSHPGPHTNISRGLLPLSHLLTASHRGTCSLTPATPPSFPSTGAGVPASSHDNLCKRRLLHSHVSATSVRQQSPNPPHLSSRSGQDPPVPRAPPGSMQHHADMRDRRCLPFPKSAPHGVNMTIYISANTRRTTAKWTKHTR